MADCPLLHKYVLNPDDDLQLQLTKLRYRLCVKEVSEELVRRSLSFEAPATDSEEDDDIQDIRVTDGNDLSNEPILHDEYDEEEEDVATPSKPSQRAPIDEETIMADTVFEVQSSLDDGGPQCMSSPLQSPIDDKTGHMTLKSDDSGIMMDESTFSMNDSMMTSGEEEISSPEAEEKPLTNGHSMENGEEIITENETTKEIVVEKKTEAISSLVAAMEDADTSPVPQITVDCPSQDEEVEESKVEEVRVEESKAVEQEGEQVGDKAEAEEKADDDKPDIEEKSDDESKENADDETVESSSEEESEEEEEEEDDSDKVDFVKEKGIRCTDAYTALEILNTRYRLTPAVKKPAKPVATKLGKPAHLYHTLPRAKVSKKKRLEVEKTKEANPERKSIITWSCWNISDMVHPVNRTSWWDKPVEPAEEDKDENANIKDLHKSIGDKAEEIDALLAKVLDEERKKKEQEERLKEAEEKDKEKPAEIVEEKLEPVEEAPIQAAVAPPAAEEPPKKKKKGNLFQRMVRSIQKRLGRNRSTA